MAATLTVRSVILFVRVLLFVQAAFIATIGWAALATLAPGYPAGSSLITALIASAVAAVSAVTALHLKQARTRAAVSAIVIECLWTALAIWIAEIPAGPTRWPYFLSAALSLIAITGLLLAPVRSHFAITRASAAENQEEQPGVQSPARVGFGRGKAVMRRGRITWLAAGGTAVAAAGCCLTMYAVARTLELVPDQAQAQAMTPAITAYLDSAAFRQSEMGNFTTADYQAGVKWLCSAAIVEVRPDGRQWQVGMDVACGDYYRRGAMMYLKDGGDMGHVVMVLSDNDRYQVVSAASENGVMPDPAWIERHFSALAAAKINSGHAPMATMPADRALLAFGCPPGVKGSYGNGEAEAWPCPQG